MQAVLIDITGPTMIQCLQIPSHLLSCMGYPFQYRLQYLKHDAKWQAIFSAHGLYVLVYNQEFLCVNSWSYHLTMIQLWQEYGFHGLDFWAEGSLLLTFHCITFRPLGRSLHMVVQLDCPSSSSGLDLD